MRDCVFYGLRKLVDSHCLLYVFSASFPRSQRLFSLFVKIELTKSRSRLREQKVVAENRAFVEFSKCKHIDDKQTENVINQRRLRVQRTKTREWKTVQFYRRFVTHLESFSLFDTLDSGIVWNLRKRQKSFLCAINQLFSWNMKSQTPEVSVQREEKSKEIRESRNSIYNETWKSFFLFRAGDDST